jgi:GNAT superfamily N-acetyltransferase
MSDAPSTAEYRLVMPETAEEFERYFDLRWRVLRAPWDQPRGSERDELESQCLHLLALSGRGIAMGIGRLQLNRPGEAQIRYMAVDAPFRGRGVGTRILQALEEEARSWGASRLVLDARIESSGFYRRHGYRDDGEGHRLFGRIDHRRMSKPL